MNCNVARRFALLTLAACAVIALGGNCLVAGEAKGKRPRPVPSQPFRKPELLVQLPADLCNTPDAMALLPDGNLVLSVPNFNDTTLPPVVLKVTPDNKVEKFFELPANPNTGKPFGSLGICVAPSGDLLIADYQMEGQQKSRVCRIQMKDGKPVGIAPVIEGFNVSNAVICHDGYLFVTDTQIDKNVEPALSGVLRFKLDELNGAPVQLKTPVQDDPHFIATIKVFDKDLKLGADGLCFDKKGNCYVGNFADGTVHRLTFGADGKVTSNEIFAKADYMKSADGLFFDAERDRILVADSKANAIHLVSLDGKVQVLAQSGDTDGLDGGMDQPCEPILRGREVIVSNMDWPVPGCINKKYDKPATLSVIKLGR